PCRQATPIGGGLSTPMLRMAAVLGKLFAPNSVLKRRGNRMLDIRSLTKVYPGSSTPALADFSLFVGEGVLGLLGPNGAGKTTLMSMLATVTKPTSGTFLWKGSDSVAAPLAVRRELGFLPQDFGVYERLTAREFLVYLGRLKGLSGKDLTHRVASMLE